MQDLISRQAAIKAVDDLPNCYNGYSDTYDKAYIIGVLEELSSAQPEQRWIPCSERLPEENDARVLVCGEKGGIRIARYWENRDYGGAFQYTFCVPGNKTMKVIAWRPLPEPYGGEE